MPAEGAIEGYKSKEDSATEVLSEDPFLQPTALLRDLRRMVIDLRADVEAERGNRTMQVEQLMAALYEERNNRELSCQEIRHSLANAIQRVDSESDRIQRRVGDCDRNLIKETKERSINCSIIAKQIKEELDELRARVNVLETEREVEKTDAYASLRSEVLLSKNSIEELAAEIRAEITMLKSETVTANSVLNKKYESLGEEYDLTKRHLQRLTDDVGHLSETSQSVQSHWSAFENMKFACVGSEESLKESSFYPHPPGTPSTMEGTSPLTSQRCSPSPNTMR